MKKNTTKRVISMGLAIIMVFGLVLTPAQSLKADAATKNCMKNLNVQCTLKKNKDTSFKTNILQVGMKSKKAKITNYKV